MANEDLLKLLKASVENWNKWREGISTLLPDLSEADLSNLDLSGVNLRGAILIGANLSESNLTRADMIFANLSGANLNRTNLSEVDLSEANLSGCNLYKSNVAGSNLTGADLHEARLIETNLSRARLIGAYLNDAHVIESNLRYADLSKAHIIDGHLVGTDLSYADLFEANLDGADLTWANLSNANLRGANFSNADLSNADFSGSNLTNSNMVRAKIDNAKISGSKIYGINVWDLDGEFDEQVELVITPEHESAITVDNIEIAQFVYLILNNKKIRDVINTLTSKTVLILGRFAIPERKEILDALRDKLRKYDLLPIVFDFDRPADKDFTETIKTLASISYFVIADVTNPKSSPLELQATIPDYQIPFVPIIQEGELPFAMMVDLQKKYNWVLDTISYDSLDTLLEILKPHIIDPAIKMRDKLRIIKAQEPTIISGRELKENDKKSKRGKP